MELQNRHIIILLILCIGSQALGDAVPVTFQRIGALVTSVTDYLLVGRIDLDPLTSELEAVQDTATWLMRASSNVSSVNPMERKVVRAQVALLGREINDLSHRIRQVKFMFRPKQARQKRSVVLALGAAALIGASVGNLLHSSYVEERLNTIKDNQGKLIKYVDLTTQLAANNQQRINLINETLTHLVLHEIAMTHFIGKEMDDLRDGERILLAIDVCQSAILHLHNAVNRLINVYTMALRGHISTELITPTEAKRQLVLVRSELPRGMQLALDDDDIMDFFKLNCHMVEQKGQLLVVVPIPVFTYAQQFTLYKHLRMPIMIQEGIDMEIISRGGFLVTNKQNTLHTELTIEEVQLCTHINNLFLCPHARILNKSTKPSCLFLLFKGEVQEARKACTHSFKRASALELSQFTETNFVASATSPQSLIQYCDQNITGRTFTIPAGISRFTLPPGCSLTSNDNFIAPGHNSSIIAEQFLINTGEHLPVSAHELLQQQYPAIDIEPDALSRMLTDMTKGGSTINFKDIVAARAAVRRDSWGLHIWSPIFTAIGLLITASFFSWVFIKYYCSAKKEEDHAAKVVYECEELEPMDTS